MSLRYGYSTGACATALAVAAWHELREGRVPDRIPVLFGDGEVRELPVQTDGTGFVSIIKDAGDDPDCTHRAALYARLRPAEAAEGVTPDSHDVELTVGEARLLLRAVEGIGLCTRPGLDCEPGKWAVNAGPRRMIAEHLERAGLTTGTWLFELGIRNGAMLAEKTLNARLGVLGGLSVLGTTGLVRPYSHDAWIATIRLCAASLAAEKQDTMVLCTGGRTTRGAKAVLSAQGMPLPDDCFVGMGDFLTESLVAAKNAGLRRVVVACMPGKLCKYAAGYDNTHAHRVPQDMALFARVTAMAAAESERPDPSDPSDTSETSDLSAVAACASVREALLLLDAPLRNAVLLRLVPLALRHFRTADADTEYRLLVFDFEGTLLLDSAVMENAHV